MNVAPTVSEIRAALETEGFTVGERDPRLNTNYPGRFMVVEWHEESELPTKDGRNGPWCIVGDDLDRLILEAYRAGILDDYGPSGEG